MLSARVEYPAISLVSLSDLPSAMVPVRIALTSDNCRLELGLSAIVGIKKNRKGTDGGQRMVMQPSPPGKVEGGLVQGQRQVINNK